MTLRRFGFVTALLLVALAAMPLGQAATTRQSAGATIVGIVAGASGPLSGIRVTLNQQARVFATTTTDREGRFRFAGVQAGRYLISASSAGLKTTNLDVTVPATGTVSVGMPMQSGQPSDSLNLVAPAPADSKQAADAARESRGGRGYVAGTPLPATVASPMPSVPFTRREMQGVGGRDLGVESYARVEPNRFKLTSAEPLSTFAADVDTASYTNVRRFLNQGALPPVDAVRVEELVNYFHYDYPEPDRDRPVSITTEVGDAPWAPGHRLVLVGLRAKAIDQDDVSGRNIVLLIDVSGSMHSADKLPLVKTGLRMFVDHLRDDDRIAIVVYAGASGLVLPSTPGRQRQRIHDAIEGLQAGGSTNGGQGLTLAYKVAQESFIRGGINRVILATDGDFNVGITGQGPLVDLIEEKKRSGIFLSVLGVGTGNLKDSTMEMLADKGNGHYAYLDSLQEARRVLVREGGATLETVAKDVKLQVEFNPAAVRAWRLVGYENRLLAHEDFNDDAKDGGEMGAGHTVTVLYEIVPAGAPLPKELSETEGRPAVDPLIYQTDRRSAGAPAAELMTVKVRYKKPAEDVSALLTQPVRAASTATRDLPLASVAAEFGLLLRTPPTTAGRWDALVTRAGALSLSGPHAAERQGLRELIELAAGLTRLGQQNGKE